MASGGKKRRCRKRLSFRPTGHRLGPDPGSGGGGGGPRGGAGGRRIRYPHRVSRRTHRTATALCGGRAKFDDGLGVRQTAFASQATRKNGTAATAIAAERRSSTRFREAGGDEPALHGFPGNHLA